MFVAYFDASGNSETSVMTMTGFIFTRTRLERFQREWTRLLPGSIPMFHMTDFASSRAGRESWRDKREQTHAGTVAPLAAAALLGGYLPARRALRMDPLASLRCE
jgi:hypothetical protein